MGLYICEAVRKIQHRGKWPSLGLCQHRKIQKPREFESRIETLDRLAASSEGVPRLLSLAIEYQLSADAVFAQTVNQLYRLDVNELAKSHEARDRQ